MGAVAVSQEINSDLIPGIATAFCSGLSETGGTCGALNGAILAVSLVEGRRSTRDSRERVYAKTRRLVSSFQEAFQHTTCPDLLQLQLGTPEASAQYQARGLHQQCEQYIRQVTHTAVKLLQET